MKVVWRISAIQSLLELEKWRVKLDLPPILHYLKESIESYFYNQDFKILIPGRTVLIKNHPVDLRLVLITIGKSGPYKVFFRLSSENIEIFLVRHPRQKSLEK